MIISGMEIRITGEGLPEMPPTVYMVEAMAEIAVELKEEAPQAAAMALWLAKAWRRDLKKRGEW